MNSSDEMDNHGSFSRDNLPPYSYELGHKCSVCDIDNTNDDTEDTEEEKYEPNHEPNNDTDDEEFEKFDIKESPYVPDCLVLKIIDYEQWYSSMTPHELKKESDMHIYVLYDTGRRVFVIRGKRVPTSMVGTKSFSFECQTKQDVYSFIRVLVSEHNVLSLELYNITDLPLNSNEITYYSLQKSANNSSLIVAYDNEPLTKTKILPRMLDSIRYVSNVYPEEENDNKDA